MADHLTTAIRCTAGHLHFSELMENPEGCRATFENLKPFNSIPCEIAWHL